MAYRHRLARFESRAEHEKVIDEDAELLSLFGAKLMCVENGMRAALKAEIKALQDQIKRDKENTTLARFIRNLESRIYAQLSRQLVENLFGETPSDSGVLELEGNRIEYSVVDGIITLNITDSDGNTTTISLPIGSFTF